MRYARLLEISDLDKFKELINRKYHAKELKSESSDEKFINCLKASGIDNIRVYGYFNNNGELLSSSCQSLWNQVPFYTMTWGLIHPKFSNTPFNKSVEESGARESFDIAVKYGESVNRFQFFYGMTLKNFKTRRDIWLDKESHLSKNYERNIETIIKAGTEPSYEPWKQIIGYQPRANDIVIRSCRLKNKNTYDILYNQKLIDIPYEEIYQNKH
jgi:hypothetical protein